MGRYVRWAYQFSLGHAGSIKIPRMVLCFLPQYFLSLLADFIPEQLLIDMGFLRHPPLEKLIEIAGDPDPKVQRAAFGYLASKFDELYDMEYDPSKYEDMPFIPATRDGHDSVGAYEEVRSFAVSSGFMELKWETGIKVYSDPSWALMGFQKVHHSVDRKIIGRLRMREAPSARQVIEIFRTSPPKDVNTATKWFAFLATKQG
jgi:hypothetical protein